jgi:hypothetical protein
LKNSFILAVILVIFLTDFTKNIIGQNQFLEKFYPSFLMSDRLHLELNCFLKYSLGIRYSNCKFDTGSLRHPNCPQHERDSNHPTLNAARNIPNGRIETAPQAVRERRNWPGEDSNLVPELSHTLPSW